MAWCPSLFVTSRCSVETAEKIEVIFGLELYLDVFYIVLNRKLGYLQKGLHGMLIVASASIESLSH